MAGSIHGDAYRILVLKPEMKTPLGGYRCRRNDFKGIFKK
jgi:hypothetical protein